MQKKLTNWVVLLCVLSSFVSASTVRAGDPPEVTLQTVTFGGLLYRVFKDQSPVPYPTPEWSRSREPDTTVTPNIPAAEGPVAPGYRQSPIAYVRNTVPSVSATFTLKNIPAGKTVWVKGDPPSGSAGYSFPMKNGSHGTYVMSASVSPGSTNPGPLYNRVDKFSLSISWQYSLDAAEPRTWTPFGSSSNTCYLLLAPPTTNLIHTLVDVGCRNGSGGSTPFSDANYKIAVFNAIWSDFANPLPGVMAAYPIDVPDYNNNVIEMKYWPRGYNNTGLFKTGVLTADRSGKCGAWTKFMRDTLQGHGISARMWVITPFYAPPAGSFPPPPGFEIDSSSFRLYPNHPAQGNAGPAVDPPGAPGLPIVFANHAIITVTGLPSPTSASGGLPPDDMVKYSVFDPSYGLRYNAGARTKNIVSSQQEWEDTCVEHIDFILKNESNQAYNVGWSPVKGTKETEWE